MNRKASSEPPRRGAAAAAKSKPQGRSASEPPPAAASAKAPPKARRSLVVDVADRREAGAHRSSEGLPAFVRTTTPVPLNEDFFPLLPALRDAKADERPALFAKKCAACCNLFTFQGKGFPRERKAKRETLLELVEAAGSKGSLDKSTFQAAIEMISKNLFRALEHQPEYVYDVMDPDEEEPFFDRQWPHIEVVYDVLLKLIVSKDVDAKVSKQFVDDAFVTQLFELFESDDPRERDTLRTVVNRIYAKFKGLQSTIRLCIRHSLQKAIYEHEMQSGIAEELELLGEILCSTSLKDELLTLLRRVLLPLHKLGTLRRYHAQLLYCMKLYVEKDPRLAREILKALAQYWPEQFTAKQLFFLDELEEMLAVVPSSEFKKVQEPVVRRIAECITCPHSQVAERVLSFWENEKFVKLVNSHQAAFFPYVVAALYVNSTQHWHSGVHGLTFQVLKKLTEAGPELFDECSSKYRQGVQRGDAVALQRQRRWMHLQKLFDRKARAMEKKRACESSKFAIACVEPNVVSFQAGGDVVAGTTSPANAEDELQAQRSEGRRSTNTKHKSVCGDAAHNPTELDLSQVQHGFALSWAQPRAVVGAELQVLFVDGDGELIDCVYGQKLAAVHEGNLIALKATVTSPLDVPAASDGSFTGSTTSSVVELGEELDAKTRAVLRTDSSEIIWVTIERLPPRVHLVLFVAASQGAGKLSSAQALTAHVIEESLGNEVARFHLDARGNDVGVALALKRRKQISASNSPSRSRKFSDPPPSAGDGIRGWCLVHVGDFSHEGRHFMDILETGLQPHIRDLLPSAPKRLKVSVQMEQGSVVSLPLSLAVRWVFIGVNWDISPFSPDHACLEVAAVLYDDCGRQVHAISADCPDAGGVRHSGSGLVGEGVTVDLECLPEDVAQLFVVGNAAWPGGTLDQLQHPTCRVLDPAGIELASYSLEAAAAATPRASGLIVARLFREPDRRRWAVQALGAMCGGVCWRDAVQDVAPLLRKTPRELQLMNGCARPSAVEAPLPGGGKRLIMSL